MSLLKMYFAYGNTRSSCSTGIEFSGYISRFVLNCETCDLLDPSQTVSIRKIQGNFTRAIQEESKSCLTYFSNWARLITKMHFEVREI